MGIRDYVLQHISCLEAKSYTLLSQLQFLVDSYFFQVHMV